MAVARTLSAAPAGVNKADAPATTPDQAKPAPHWWVTVAVVAGVLFGWWLVCMNVALKPPMTREVEGLSVVALFYVVTQVVERFLEPFASLEPFTPARHEQARDLAVMAGDATGAANAQSRIDQWRADRGIVLSAVATVTGIWISAQLGLYFLVAVGVQYEAVTRGVHALATGLVIGGGTKPLHDLITRIQKAKDNAKDPGEVSA